MFEVDVKNLTEEEGRRRRRGPARVWGSDLSHYIAIETTETHLNLVYSPLPLAPLEGF